MIVESIKTVLRPVKKALTKNIDRFLRDVSGIVHVGANTGQERNEYESLNLRVIWVEPIPHVFAELQQNIADFPNQRAYQALLTDADNKSYEFNVSSNNGESSSIYDFKDHKDIWPDVSMSQKISLTSLTLPSLFQREEVDPALYQALILDTQGSELLVLQGSVPLLQGFTYIKSEVPDFESYEGCCQLDEMNEFMTQHGFAEFQRKRVAGRSGVGTYYEIVYKRVA